MGRAPGRRERAAAREPSDGIAGVGKPAGEAEQEPRQRHPRPAGAEGEAGEPEHEPQIGAQCAAREQRRSAAGRGEGARSRVHLPGARITPGAVSQEKSSSRQRQSLWPRVRSGFGLPTTAPDQEARLADRVDVESGLVESEPGTAAEPRRVAPRRRWRPGRGPGPGTRRTGDDASIDRRPHARPDRIRSLLAILFSDELSRFLTVGRYIRRVRELSEPERPMTGLAVVRNIGSPRALRSAEDVEDFEQEIVDQYALAMAAAGLSDGHVGNTRSVVIEFARSLGGPLWSATCDDADRFLAEQRRAGRSVSHPGGQGGRAGAVLRVRDQPLSGRHPRA